MNLQFITQELKNPNIGIGFALKFNIGTGIGSNFGIGTSLVTILFVPRSRRSKFTFCIHYIEVKLVLSTFKRTLVFYPYC